MDEKIIEDTKELNSRTRWNSKEDHKKFIFTSIDKKNNLNWVHRNIIIKDGSSVAPKNAPPSIQNQNFDGVESDGEAVREETAIED